MILFKSKIDNINIIHTESELNSSNKKQQVSKTAGVDISIKTQPKTQNKSVDLGKGAIFYKVTFSAKEQKDNNAIIDILSKKRKCTIIDKYYGELHVYIDNYKIINKDKHIDSVIFKVIAIVEDLDIDVATNYNTAIEKEIKSMRKEFAFNLEKLAKTISSGETFIDQANGAIKFLDSSLNEIDSVLTSVFELEGAGVDAYNSIKQSVAKLESFRQASINIYNNTKDFTNSLIDIANSNTSDVMLEIQDSNKIAKSKLEQSKIDKDNLTAECINNLLAIKEANALLNNSFRTQDNFLQTLNNLTKRVYFCGIDSQIARERVLLFRQYALQAHYKEIYTKQIKTPTDLIWIVFKEYGNLDLYDAINKLNNFKDNEQIIGAVKLYANNNK